MLRQTALRATVLPRTALSRLAARPLCMHDDFKPKIKSYAGDDGDERLDHGHRLAVARALAQVPAQRARQASRHSDARDKVPTTTPSRLSFTAAGLWTTCDFEQTLVIASQLGQR